MCQERDLRPQVSLARNVRQPPTRSRLSRRVLCRASVRQHHKTTSCWRSVLRPCLIAGIFCSVVDPAPHFPVFSPPTALNIGGSHCSSARRVALSVRSFIERPFGSFATFPRLVEPFAASNRLTSQQSSIGSYQSEDGNAISQATSCCLTSAILLGVSKCGLTLTDTVNRRH